jgi:hypothetical protein
MHEGRGEKQQRDHHASSGRYHVRRVSYIWSMWSCKENGAELGILKVELDRIQH